MPELLNSSWEWLNTAVPENGDLTSPIVQLVFPLALAFVMGCVVAGIYRWTHGKVNGQSARMMTTLVLLTVLIGMVTLVIGNSVARAFSLVGALAIVRFRTVVEDTRDTAFVIFAVAVGMAIGAGFWKVPLVSLPFVALAACLFRPRETGFLESPADGSLVVRVGVGFDPEALLRESFVKHLVGSRLVRTETARQGTALELTFSVRLRDPRGALPLVTELNGIEGIQGVELRQT